MKKDFITAKERMEPLVYDPLTLVDKVIAGPLVALIIIGVTVIVGVTFL